MKKAAVLPEPLTLVLEISKVQVELLPVWATAIKSWPVMIAGME